MTNKSNDKPEDLGPTIQRGRLDTLTIYDVSESELDTLERGSPDSLFLNLAIFVLSVAISFSITLATTDVSSTRLFCVFVILTVVGYLAGATFGLLWWTSHKSVKSVVKRIRERVPPEGNRVPSESEDEKS